MKPNRKYYYCGIVAMIYSAKQLLPDYAFRTLALSIREVLTRAEKEEDFVN